MKIWIVNHYAIPPVEAGITRHYSLGKELINRGHQVAVIAANFNHQKRTPFINGEGNRVFERQYNDVPFIWVNVPQYKSNSPARVYNMLSFSKALLTHKFFRGTTPPDVIIGSSPHIFAALAAQLMARKWKIPFIFEVRDLWPQSLIDLGKVNPKHPVVRILARLEKYLYTQSDKIITPLPGAYRYIESIGIDPNKIVWIPNGIDFKDFSRYEQELKNDKDKFVVMYAGNHGVANGLEVIVESAKVLQNKGYSGILFKLIGDGPYKEELKKMAIEQQLKNVKFYEPIPKTQIPRVLSMADAFVLPLKNAPVFQWGVSPNKLYDYLYSGKPIIYAVNAYNNPVEEAEAGITIPPEDPAMLAQAVLKLYHMKPSERKEMGLRGTKYVENNYNISQLAIKLERVLEECINITA